MLKHSIQIELFLILWVPKLIYSESPMYTVLDKDTKNLWKRRIKRDKCLRNACQ